MRLTYPSPNLRQLPTAWLLWVAITVLFLYERTYLIQKAGLPYFAQCAVVRVGLLLLLCTIHLRWLVPAFLDQRRYGSYGLLTTLSVGAYLLVQGGYDQYLFGFVIGDPERRGFSPNVPYNGIATAWYLLVTYLVHRNARPNRDWASVKPVEPASLPDADLTVLIKTGTQHVRLRLDTITHARGLKDYTILFTQTDRYIIKGSIGKVAEGLPTGHFLRVHKSYVVAKRFIRSVSHQRVRVADKAIPVGRAFAGELADFLQNATRGNG